MRSRSARPRTNGQGPASSTPRAEALRIAVEKIEETLAALPPQADQVADRVRSVSRVPRHTHDIHLRRDLRCLAGRPPDRPVDGLKDCRIYEALLEIARNDQSNARPRFLVTRDSDFDVGELIGELAGLGFKIRKDPGRLYGELK